MKKVNIKPLSVNQAWMGRRFKTKKYKQYEKDVLSLLQGCKIPEGEIIILLEFGMSSVLSDWDNPVKPFQDIIQKKYGFNDSKIKIGLVKKTKVKKGEEFIKFKLSPYVDIWDDILALF